MAIIVVRVNVTNEPERQAASEGRCPQCGANYSGPFNIYALIGGTIHLPCNITAPSFDDGVSLVLWYRDDIASPIYTVDARSSASLESAQHFLHRDIFEKRASFNLSYPLSFLRIKPVKSSDGGDYRCRVDFRRARTVNRILKLTVIGNPLPAVHWWKGSHLIDTDYFVVNNSISRNVLTLANLTRDDLLMTLTCQAYNTNLTVAVSQSITLDLHLKPREIRIITPLQNITSSQSAIELACQCTGSKSSSIRWTVQGKVKGSDVIEPFSETVSEDGLTTTSFLSLAPSIEDNGKLIVCSCFNPSIVANFSIQDTWPINIYYLPILSLIMGSNSHSQDIIEGSNVYFECNIKANPSVTLVGWKLNGHLLDSTTATTADIEIRNTSLLVTNVNHDHYGEYQCLATNSLGSASSESVFLDVKYAPKCTHARVIAIGVALEETVAIECQVRANPSENIIFEWTTNSTLSPKVPLSFSSSGLKSVAKFVATSEQDYGLVQCWSRNSIGKQLIPCRYQIIKAEAPSQPHNCSLVNKTANSLTLECLPGHAGGLEQSFHLQVYSLNPHKLLKNLSNAEAPYFAIQNLPAGYIFKMIIYSANRKGKSKSIEITGSTTEPSPWKSGMWAEVACEGV
ncbi:PREDICTED: nephrin-like [Rhagoletis zephyria]|uniref:nephrin-like n=1 Tax=Rhagoletis zephyria TaxID=28612 RepID=UPI0008117E7C|nr:PREDICTED: nephrin-like [Rhagoletis zephyria]